MCGECKLTINEFEPIRCGFCEKNYHINQQCCGINSRVCREFLAQGKIIYICPTCRETLNGRSINAYVDSSINTYVDSLQLNQPQLLTDLPNQVQKLFDIVDVLSKKIDNLPSNSTSENPPVGTPNVMMSTTPVWPVKSVKRRRIERMPMQIESDRGENDIDLSDLSVPSIVPVAVQNRFWLYLSGLNPQLSDSDIQKIISRCLHTTEPVIAVRLVRKGIDTSNFTYVSYKIGLDPKYKDAALNPASWPTGMLFREFVNMPKN